MRQRIEATASRYAWLVCEVDAQVAGYAYASTFHERVAYRWAVAVSIYLASGHRRTGMGMALYTALLPLLRLQGFLSAYAGIALPNEGSVGLHERLGFALAGSFPTAGYKQGAWRDVGWWRLELGPHEGAPREPLSTAEASQLPGWSEAIAAGEALLHGGASQET
jgi:phosphinothricin acetyltransferase